MSSILQLVLFENIEEPDTPAAELGKPMPASPVKEARDSLATVQENKATCAKGSCELT
jgi:hypothetical protein